jgi:HK97 family phage major capsid protein
VVIPAEEPEATPEDAPSIGDAVIADNEPVYIEVREQITMSEEQTQNERAELDSLRAEIKAQNDMLSKFMQEIEKAPRQVVAGYYSVDGGTADPSVKSLGDFMLSVMRGDNKRLEQIYGSVKGVSFKGQSAGDATAGGYMIPEGFMDNIGREINLTSGIANLVTTIPVSLPSGSMPSDDFYTAPTAGSGDTAEASGLGTNIRAEGGAYTEESITFTNIEWRVRDVLSGYVKATRELRNYAPTIDAILSRKIAIELGSKREKFILRGIGGSQPLGILNWAGAVGIAPDTNNVFAVADADEMLSRHLQYASNPVWIIHPSIIPDIAGMERGTGAGAYQSNIAQALSTTLHGYPIIRSQHLPQANNAGCVILADLGAYALFTYGGMYVDFSEHADFLNGNGVWRFGQEMDGKPLMKTSVTLADPQGSYTVSPFVYLND